MANTQSIIELVFQGVNKTDAATQAAISNTKAFSTNVNQATQPIADFTTGALKLEATLLAAGLAVTAFSVKIAGDFDTAFREISTLIDQPIEDLGEFQDAILSYASTSTKPLEEITQSIYSAISAGVDYGDSIEAVAIAEKLAVAGKAELSDSLVVLVSSLNAYGVGMEDAERFSDALFTTVKQGQTTLPELAGSLASVTGLAATAGVDFEELLAAVATLTSTGTPTSQAITQIQGAISAILKPTSQASGLAKELGIEFNAERLAAVGLTGVLEDVKSATGGNTAEMALLFGRVEALNGMLTLTGLGAEKFQENLQAMASSAGSVDAAFAVMVQSVDASAQKIQNALTGLFISIGAPLLDEFGAVADAIAAIFNALGDSARAQDGGVAQIVAYIESQFGGLQTTLETVAANLPDALEKADFSGFTNGVDAVSDAISDLLGDIDLSTVDGLASAITLVGKAFESLSEFTGGVISSFKPLFDQFTQIGEKAAGLGPDFFEAAGEMAGFATQANILTGALNKMFPVIEGLIALMAVNQARSLAGGFAAAATSISGSKGLIALLGKGGLLGAALAGGVGVGTLLDKAVELGTDKSLSDRVSDWLTSFTDLDEQAEELTSTTKLLREEIAKPPQKVGIVEAMEEIDGIEIHDLTAEFEAIEERAKTTGTVITWVSENMQAALDKAADSENLAEFANSTEGIAAAAANLIPVLDGATGKIIDFRQGNDESINILKELQGVTGNYREDIGSVVTSLDAATEAQKEFNSEAEKMEHEELLARIAAAADVATARIEANAEIMKSAFSSVDNSITSTGDLLGDLFGLFEGNKLSISEKFDVKEQIEIENALREESFKLQEKLTKATVDNLNAQTKALDSGGGLITIQGDGLAPHLEAFMWEILKQVQIRMNQEGLGLLLGV